MKAGFELNFSYYSPGLCLETAFILFIPEFRVHRPRPRVFKGSDPFGGYVAEMKHGKRMGLKDHRTEPVSIIQNQGN